MKVNTQGPCTEQEKKDAQFKLSKVLVRVITSEPFYATLLMQRRPKLSEQFPTAWVDGPGQIFFNPRFVLKHSVDEMIGVAIHEVLHKVFFHVQRLATRHPKKWNVACDAIINDIIVRQQHYKLPDGGVMFPEDKVRGKTADQVYAEMEDDPSDGGGFDGADGDMINDGTMTEADVLDIKQQVAAAVENAKKQGKMPAGLDRLLTDLFDPKKDWKELLELALTTALMGNARFSFSKPSHAGRVTGLCLPGLSKGVQLRKAVIGVDTSGSIDEKTLKTFVSETRGILASCGVQEAHIVYCDARIHDVHIVPSGEEYVPAKIGGGGGTRFEPVFEYADSEDAECVVYFTDMYGSFPDRPDYPVVWAATTDVEGPWGQTVQIEV